MKFRDHWKNFTFSGKGMGALRKKIIENQVRELQRGSIPKYISKYHNAARPASHTRR